MRGTQLSSTSLKHRLQQKLKHWL